MPTIRSAGAPQAGNAGSRADAHARPCVQARWLRRGETTEVYLTGIPARGGDQARQARDLFTSIRRHVDGMGGRLFGERVFATREVMPLVNAARAEAYGSLDDGIPPTRLLVEPGDRDGFLGVQVHAVAAPTPPRVMRCCSQIEGMAARILERGPDRWLFVNGLSVAAPNGHGGANERHTPARPPVEPGKQAERMFTCAGCFLRQAGGTMRSVARTWLWLGDVCSWYDQLNDVRREFFEREGLLSLDPSIPVTPSQRGGRVPLEILESTTHAPSTDASAMTRHLPASTGIGIPPATDSICAMDMIALPGREDELRFIEAGGDQGSAFEYGSAFSRAAIAPMPAGYTLFISGTAAIDDRGETEAIGQIESQIRNTLAHVRALLREQGCGDRHVLTALAYCKSKAVEQVFRERFADLAWPMVTMIGEVCRPELLFEVEVTASAAAMKGPEGSPCDR